MHHPHCEWAHTVAPPQRDLQYSDAKTNTRTHTHSLGGTHVRGAIRQSKGWWWLWHIAMPPTVVPVRGQSTSNWASVTHALCQSSSPALACNVWHIAEPPTGLLSPCPADNDGEVGRRGGRGDNWGYRPRRQILPDRPLGVKGGCVSACVSVCVCL